MDYLGAFRASSTATTAAAAEALLHIASGVDSVAELQTAMGVPSRTAHRLVGLLLGRATYRQGDWKDSPFSLIEARPHPHKQGRQLVLSDQGLRLVSVLSPGKN